MRENGNSNENNREDANKPDLERVQENGATTSSRVSRARKDGFLPVRTIAVLTVFIAGGAIGYEVWRNPNLMAPSWAAGTPNIDDTPAGEQFWASEHYQNNLRQHDEDVAREAQDNDMSFIATPDEAFRQIDVKSPAIAPNQNRPLHNANTPVKDQHSRTVAIEHQQPIQPRLQPTSNKPAAPDYAKIIQLAQLMAAQQQGLLRAWKVQPSGVTVVDERDLVPTMDRLVLKQLP